MGFLNRYNRPITYFIGLALLLVVNLVVRWYYRGDHIPGWDLIGVGAGLYSFETNGLFESISTAFKNSRNVWYWTGANSLFFSALPAWLTSFFPWMFWSHLINLLFFGVTLVFIFKYFDFDLKAGALVLALVCSSAALPSFAIAGYPYITGFLPHIICLVWLKFYFSKQSDWKRILIALALMELSLHVYEVGKTIFIIYAVALVILDWKLKDRLYLAALAVSQMGLIYYIGGANVQSRVGGIGKQFSAFSEAPLEQLKPLFTNFGYELPGLFIVGVLSIFFVKKNRLFLATLWMSQLALFVLEYFAHGVHNDMRPRRVTVFLFYTILLITQVYVDWLPKLVFRRVVYAVTSILVLIQCWYLYDFNQTPVDKRRWTLPYVYSRADYQVSAPFIAETNAFIDKVKNDTAFSVFFYDYDVSRENSTDPNCFPTRLAINLSYDVLRQKVMFVGKNNNRYSSFPMTYTENFKNIFDSLLKTHKTLKVYVFNGLWSRNNNRVEGSKAVLAETLNKYSWENCEMGEVFGKQWTCYQYQSDGLIGSTEIKEERQ